jgi:glycerophosphoryl diester phosphodiesterase
MLRIISHRGNIFGPNSVDENTKGSIQNAIDHGFDVEIDVWLTNDIIMLGHDSPQQMVELSWLESRKNYLWIHCKNIEAVIYFSKIDDFNYFWHQNDNVTLTSKKYIWAFPGLQPIENSIAVMPEIHNDDVSLCVGICTDFPIKYTRI